MAEEDEVEEGEICCYKDTDYIDEKLQSVLGNLHKDFQGVISAEILGTKFGVYGTFLSPYQSFPPILSPRKSVQESNQVSMITSLNPTRVGSDRTVHTMTSFPVPLLSPLHDNLLTLSRNKDHHQVTSSSVEFQSFDSNCCRSLSSFRVDCDISDTVSLPKKADDRVVSHKPYQPKRPHTEKQSFDLTSGDEPPVSPFTIEEDWIPCDKCHKWRLLPYGTKPEQLPETWLCSMLNWLPGMNHCDISEEDTTRALHALYQILILNNLQNRGGKGSIDVKAHNGREISVTKRKLRDQDYLMTWQCNGNHSGDNDVNAIEREVSGGFRKQKKSKVFQTEKRESSTSKSKGEEKSRTRGTVTRIIPGIKDSPPIDRRRTVEREYQTNKYRVKLQSRAEFGKIPKQVCMFPSRRPLDMGRK